MSMAISDGSQRESLMYVTTVLINIWLLEATRLPLYGKAMNLGQIKKFRTMSYIEKYVKLPT